jgi:hypothetical protein
MLEHDERPIVWRVETAERLVEEASATDQEIARLLAEDSVDSEALANARDQILYLRMEARALGVVETEEIAQLLTDL